ncbi:MAG: flavin reductase [Thermoleophilia bacterium]|nr:flavin reductase [Thermoleophilia bacterium]MDH3725543.1 flavin reductase [Thermoleophilia bacterium]
MPLSDSAPEPIELAPGSGLFERFFSVAPLVIVGTLDDTGEPNLAPKHLAMPLGWENRFGFVCTPRHRTFGNAIRSGAFTVSFPRLEQLIQISQSATPRTLSGSKPGLRALATFPARHVEGVLVAGAAIFLECELEQVVETSADNGLLIGKVVGAAADPRVVRDPDRDDAEMLRDQPLLAYVAPGRVAEIASTHAFPYPSGFTR